MFSPICGRCTRNDSCPVRNNIGACPEENNRILHQMIEWVEKRREAKQRYAEWHDEYKRIVSEHYTREEWKDSMDTELVIRTELSLCEERIVNLAEQLLD